MIKYKLAQTYIPERVEPFDNDYKDNYFKIIIGTHPGIDENGNYISIDELENNRYFINIKPVFNRDSYDNEKYEYAENNFFYYMLGTKGADFSKKAWTKFTNSGINLTLGTGESEQCIYIVGHGDLAYAPDSFEPYFPNMGRFYHFKLNDYYDANDNRGIAPTVTIKLDCKIGTGNELRDAKDIAVKKFIRIGGCYNSLYSGYGPKPYNSPDNWNTINWDRYVSIKNGSEQDADPVAIKLDSDFCYGTGYDTPLNTELYLSGIMKPHSYDSFFANNKYIYTTPFFQEKPKASNNTTGFDWDLFNPYNTKFAEHSCKYMFNKCENLSTATIPFIWSTGTNYMGNLGDEPFYHAFEYCSNLKEINIRFFTTDNDQKQLFLQDKYWASSTYTEYLDSNGNKINNVQKLDEIIGASQLTSSGAGGGIFGSYSTAQPGYNVNTNNRILNFHNVPDIPTTSNDEYDLNSNIFGTYSNIANILLQYTGWNLYINGTSLNFKWNLLEAYVYKTNNLGNYAVNGYTNYDDAKHVSISLVLPKNDPIRNIYNTLGENVSFFGFDGYINASSKDNHSIYIQPLFNYNNITEIFKRRYIDEIYFDYKGQMNWFNLQKIPIRINANYCPDKKATDLTVWGVKYNNNLLVIRTTKLPVAFAENINNLSYDSNDSVAYDANNKCNLLDANGKTDLTTFRDYNHKGSGTQYGNEDFLIRISTLPSNVLTFI